jgi:hypothetical protein
MATAGAALAVPAGGTEASRGDQISASHAAARTLGDCFRQRSNRIVAHKLRKKRQLELFLRGVSAMSVICVCRLLFQQFLHDRQPLTIDSSDAKLCHHQVEKGVAICNKMQLQREKGLCVNRIEAFQPRLLPNGGWRAPRLAIAPGATG